jgi:diguanylate cyclase (GGDEF)-like protein
MIHLSEMEARVIIEGCATVDQQLSRLVNGLRTILGLGSQLPGAVNDFLRDLTALQGALNQRSPEHPDADLDPIHAPMLRTVLQARRREVAENLERNRVAAGNPEAIALVEERLVPYDNLIRQPWFINAQPRRIPKPLDYLTLQRAGEFMPPQMQTAGILDDKFGILLALSGLVSDLSSTRSHCAVRDVPVALTFLDIDNFKDLNTKYLETNVDRDVLPPFMRAVDSTVFGHGRAYKYGGDECVLLVPNCGLELMLALLDMLRGILADLKYPLIKERPTISCGVCILPPDSWLTDREAIDRASAANRHAKEAGKNRVASYRGELYRDEDRVIVRGG